MATPAAADRGALVGVCQSGARLTRAVVHGCSGSTSSAPTEALTRADAAQQRTLTTEDALLASGGRSCCRSTEPDVATADPAAVPAS
jgi:hypothetical protein